LTTAEDALYNCYDPRHCRKLVRVDDTSATPACDAGSPVRLVVEQFDGGRCKKRKAKKRNTMSS